MGSGSTGYYGGGGSSFLFFILFIIAFIVVPILWNYFKSSISKNSGFNKINPEGPETPDEVEGYQEFLRQNPEFKLEEFQAKVEKAFIEIQNSWSKGEISAARRFMTDGVYQRFTTQLAMMKLLKQRDEQSDIQVSSIFLAQVDVDGNYDILHMGINAGMSDQFVSETDHSLDSPGNYEEFVEYWSFMRKRGKGGKDIYSSNNCPQCSAPLPEKLGDAGKCPYCNAFVNNAEYDWVLSEITQADDFMMSTFRGDKSSELIETVRSLEKDNEDFCVQLIEDKVSNGYFQIKTAQAFQEPERMRRFVSDQAYEKIKSSFPKERIVYNRLYLNDVSLLAVRQAGDKNILYVGIKSTYQRAVLEGSRAGLYDSTLMTKSEVVLLERDKKAGLSKGSVYAHLCPSCGGLVNDSIDLKCVYCGQLLNSSRIEWIITDLISLQQYEGQLLENPGSFDSKISYSLDDSLYAVKDFAFNNILVIFSADGVFADEEKKMAESIAKKWGYKLDVVDTMIQAAMSGRLSLRMPLDPAKCKVIYDLMVQAAKADGKIDPTEQKILDLVRKEYLKEE